MDLIDRYLASVRRHLPRTAQDDIIQELSDSLRSEVEEREQIAGHALSDDEQAELLRKHGHPWLMASRYTPQQYLIGPALFPYYRQAIELVVLWVVLPITLLTAVISEFSSGLSSGIISHLIAGAWNGSIHAVGIVTVVFFVLEKERVRFTALESWEPKRLPEYRDGRLLPRSETVPALVFTVLFLLWWTGAIRLPYFAWHNGEPVQFVAAAISSRIYTPVLLMAIAWLLAAMIDVVRPWRTLLRSAIDMTLNVSAVVMLLWILQMRPLFVEAIGANASADTVTQVARFVNNSLTWGLMVLAAVIVLDTLYELWMVTRSRRAIRAGSA